MYIDRIDLSLPETQVSALLSSFGSALDTLQILPSVSLPDRKRYAKLGLKNEALARQILEVGRANPGIIPRDIDFEKIDRDLLAREQLRSLKLVLEALLGKVNDSMLLTGVDIYAAALSIYHCLRRNAQTTSLREVVEELKRGFARPSRKKKQEQMEEAAPAPISAPAEIPAQQKTPPVKEPSNATAPASPQPAPAPVMAPLSLTLPHHPRILFSGSFLPSTDGSAPDWQNPQIPRGIGFPPLGLREHAGLRL